MIILNSALFLWGFYYLFVIVMGAYRLHLSKRLMWATYILFAPAVLAGLIADVICQYTFASLYFKEWPAEKEYLVTDRLQRYMTFPGTAKYKKAKWFCDNLLDPIDPTGKHC